MATSLRVGLELGTRTLSAAWALTSRGGKVRWHYRQQSRSDETNREELARDLAQLLAPLRRYRLKARLLLSAPSSSLHQTTLQLADPSRLAEAVREHLPKILPFDAERAQVKFITRRQQQVETGLECLVAIAACERSGLEQHLEALWHSGWAPSGVVPAGLALLNTANTLGAVREEPLVLVDIGSHQSTIVLVNEAEAVYARDIALGDDHLTDALMSQVSLPQGALTLSREQAHALKRNIGIPDSQSATVVGEPPIPVETYRAMLQPVLEQLVAEIRRTMTFGAYTAMAASPKGILIAGEGSRLPNFAHWLSGQLGVPVTRLHCEKFLGSEGASAAVVCGLALFEQLPALDLQLPSVRRRRRVARAIERTWQGVAALTLLLWLGAGWWLMRDRALVEPLQSLNAKLTVFSPVIETQEALAVQSQLVRSLVSHGVNVEWFRRLPAQMPSPVRLTQLSVSAAMRQVQMTGEAQSWEQTPEASVSELTLKLEQAEVCRHADLGSTRRSSTNEELVEFTLTCELAP